MVCLQKKSCRASGHMVFICTAPKNWRDMFFSRYMGKLTIKLKKRGIFTLTIHSENPTLPFCFFFFKMQRKVRWFVSYIKNSTECQVTWYLYAWHRKTDVTYFLVDIWVKYYNQYKRPVLTKRKIKIIFLKKKHYNPSEVHTGLTY
jgi:hypothetical protein